MTDEKRKGNKIWKDIQVESAILMTYISTPRPDDIPAQSRKVAALFIELAESHEYYNDLYDAEATT